MSNAQLVTVCPVLPARDPQASAKWYCAKLGFRLRQTLPGFRRLERRALKPTHQLNHLTPQSNLKSNPSRPTSW